MIYNCLFLKRKKNSGNLEERKKMTINLKKRYDDKIKCYDPKFENNYGMFPKKKSTSQTVACLVRL